MLPTPVVVENHSLFDMFITDIPQKIDTWKTLKIFGPDTSRFLNGQLTSDVSKMFNFSFELTSRTNRTGNLQSFGYLLKESEEIFYFYSETEMVELFKEDLNKFIIMDDVEIEDYNQQISLSSIKLHEDFFVGNFLGLPVSMSFGTSEDSLEIDSVKNLSFLYGLPETTGNLINDYSLVDTSVSMEKGCYLGQETINKIENNRGAGKKEIIVQFEEDLPNISPGDSLDIEDESYELLSYIKFDGKFLCKIKAKREIRIEGKSVTSKIADGIFQGVVRNFPFEIEDVQRASVLLFEDGSELFSKDEDKKARDYFYASLKLNPNNPEVLESLGVLEGRLGNYKAGIELMDRLEKVDPNSVMPFTNRSLFFMNLGEIEKAEDEKAKATLKSFGGESKDDDSLKEEKLRRLGMYEEVLTIDDEDIMANVGAAQINFELGNYEKSLSFAEKVMELDKKDVRPWSLKIKILIALGEGDKAREISDEAMALASANGEFVLANEIQSLINSLATS